MLNSRMTTGWLLLSFIFLWFIGGCSVSDERSIIIGYLADAPSVYKDSRIMKAYESEQDIISAVVEDRVDFGYVHLEKAVEQYLLGKPIVAIDGFEDLHHNKRVLITHSRQIHIQPELIRKAVGNFRTLAEQSSCVPIDLDEDELKKTVKAPKKINLSWFIDRSFKSLD